MSSGFNQTGDQHEQDEVVILKPEERFPIGGLPADQLNKRAAGFEHLLIRGGPEQTVYAMARSNHDALLSRAEEEFKNPDGAFAGEDPTHFGISDGSKQLLQSQTVVTEMRTRNV